MSAAKLERKLDNARRAEARLRAFLAEEIRSDRDMAGVIQAFEFTFEATWKLLQAWVATQGLDTASPREALAAGYRVGLCDDEDICLSMLADRNRTSHTYDAAEAEKIFTRVRGSYARVLRAIIEATAARF